MAGSHEPPGSSGKPLPPASTRPTACAWTLVCVPCQSWWFFCKSVSMDCCKTLPDELGKMNPVRRLDVRTAREVGRGWGLDTS
jgi:hypothetical protein